MNKSEMIKIIKSYPGFRYFKEDDDVYFDLEYCNDSFMYFDTLDGDEIRYWTKFSTCFDEKNNKDKICTYCCTSEKYENATEEWLRDLITKQLQEYKRLVNEWKKSCIAADFEQ